MIAAFKKIHYLLTPPERKGGVALVGLMLIGAVLETIGIGLVIPAMALLMQADPAVRHPMLRPVLAYLGHPTQMQLVADGMLILVGIWLIKAVFLAFLVWRQNSFAFGVQAELSQRLFATYLRQPYTFHLERNSAQLIRNTVTEINQFTVFGILPGLLVITEFFVLAGIGGLLVVVEPLGTAIVAILLTAVAAGFHAGTRDAITRWGLARQYHEGRRIQHLQEGLGGAKDVKLLGREDDFLAQYRVHTSQSVRVGQLHQTLLQLPRLWLELLALAGLATLVLSMLARGRNVESIIPTLGLFAAAAFRFMPSVNRVIGAVQSLRFGLPIIDTLFDDLSLASPEPAPANANVQGFNVRIELCAVSFTYRSAAAPALKAVSFTIKTGESVGFIGPSGSGKSTLVDVILGLLTPDAGAVTVDGCDIQRDLRSWQNQVGYVPQSIFLTDDTLRRNVAFGLSDAQIDDGAIERAIRAAQLEEFVASLPIGLETIVGERGVRLSGGQRQRIGIARALYHDPPVLVLDEATSALDTPTERDVMEAVTALHGTKTILIVAHRLSTVEHCDRLYRLEAGRVTAEGAPADVLYARKVV